MRLEIRLGLETRLVSQSVQPLTIRKFVMFRLSRGPSCVNSRRGREEGRREGREGGERAP